MLGVKTSDCYCTPLWLTERLPIVDLDPCSNPRSHVRAKDACSLETGRNGLEEEWGGSVFLNWPYSNPKPWVKKLNAEVLAGRCTQAIVLPKYDHSTSWWRPLVSHPDTDIWLLDDRLQFDIPPEKLEEMQRAWLAKGKKGKCPTSNNFCSAIIHRRANSLLQPPLELHDVAMLVRQI